MKFIKSSFMKKVIIILIAIMLFNFAIPNEVKAWVPSIIVAPVIGLVTCVVSIVDILLGCLLNGFNVGFSSIGYIFDLIADDDAEALKQREEVLNKLFVGPDTIFTGNVVWLNANIFKKAEMPDWDKNWSETEKAIFAGIAGIAGGVVRRSCRWCSSEEL